MSDLRRAATWGFWSGCAALPVCYARAVVLRRGARPPELSREVGIAFVAGAALGAGLYVYLRRLEKAADSSAS